MLARSLLRRVPSEALVPPLVAGDRYALVRAPDRRVGQAVVAVLPGGRRVGGRLCTLGGAWWLLRDGVDLIALGPGVELLRALVFRPI
jgi:hypothetical protein